MQHTHSGGPSSIPRQGMWDLGFGHSGARGVFSEYFVFPVLIALPAAYSLIMLIGTLYSLNTDSVVK
jgi:hypothetical protein